MIVAALVFEAHLCRDDPNRILTYPIRQLLFWYDLCVGWRKEVNKQTAADKQASRAVTRPFTR